MRNNHRAPDNPDDRQSDTGGLPDADPHPHVGS
jgi:hypothetical protein